MDISTILVAIFILIIDAVFITIHIKNKIILASKNKYRIILPVMIIVFVILTAVTKKIEVKDIVVLIEILPLAFVGNKCGITQNGLLANSYVTTWAKIESYSLEEQENRYILHYKTNVGVKKMFFKMEDKEEVKKYLLGIRKLKYARK